MIGALHGSPVLPISTHYWITHSGLLLTNHRAFSTLQTNWYVCNFSGVSTEHQKGLSVSQTAILRLGIGDDIPNRRLSDGSYSGQVTLLGKPMHIDITEYALHTAAENPYPILVELELYFSCLVRKQIRFRELAQLEPENPQYARVIPGLYTCFRAVTTQHCSVEDVAGKPPVETMPVKKPGLFVPDWLRIDYRSGQWLGEYGFSRNT
jgi:hypothetical protein